MFALSAVVADRLDLLVEIARSRIVSSRSKHCMGRSRISRTTSGHGFDRCACTCSSS